MRGEGKEKLWRRDVRLEGEGVRAPAPLDVYVVGFMWFMGDVRGEMGLEKG